MRARRTGRNLALMASAAALGLGLLVAGGATAKRATPAPKPVKVTPAGPTYSSPIALSGDGKLVWTVNPGNDTVSVIRTDTNRIVGKVTVGNEPQSIALDPAGRYAYVANAADSSITVIKITNPKPSRFAAKPDTSFGPKGRITTGAEPWNIVASPDGLRVFVANSGQDTISVLDVAGRTLIGHVNLRTSICNDPDRSRHFQPRHRGADRGRSGSTFHSSRSS